MMFNSARIIAIDDQQPDLEALEARIKEMGSSCLSIRYESMASLPNVNLKGIRIVFMDINLIGGGSPGENTRNYTAIQAILNKLITDENGPYALATWTDTQCHKELIAFLRERLIAHKQPFVVAALDKNELLNDAPKLLKALKGMHSALPQMAALLDWERRVEEASIKTIHTIVSLSQLGNSPDKFSGKLDETLSVMAIAAVGKENVSKDKLAAVNESLIPILYDKLLHICSESIPNKLWNKAITKLDPSPRLTDKQKGQINEALHVSKQIEKIAPYERGVIIKLPKTWLKDKAFKERFHTTITKTAEEQYRVEKTEIIEWALIQLQAECDHAQSQPGPVPFALVIIRKYQKNLKNGSPPAAVWRSPIFCGEQGEPYEIILNSRYLISINKDVMTKKQYKIWGRFREHLVNSATNHIHSYGQRPGYISL